MKDFILAALPFLVIVVVIGVTVFCGLRAKRRQEAAQNAPAGKTPEPQSDGTHMCLGMCIGMAVGMFCSNLSSSWNQGTCMTMGMCFGMMIGALIDADQLKKAKEAAKRAETEKTQAAEPAAQEENKD